MRLVDSTRANLDDSIGKSEINSLVETPELKVVQTSSPVMGSTWDPLNDRLFSRRPDVQLRIYGHYSTECDLNFARKMTNVRNFAADCLMTAANVESIAEIPDLQSLSLGIFGLEDFGVLEQVSPGLVWRHSLGSRSYRGSTLKATPRTSRFWGI